MDAAKRSDHVIGDPGIANVAVAGARSRDHGKAVEHADLTQQFIHRALTRWVGEHLQAIDSHKTAAAHSQIIEEVTSSTGNTERLRKRQPAAGWCRQRIENDEVGLPADALGDLAKYRLADAGSSTELDEAMLVRRLIQRGDGMEPGEMHARDRRANPRERQPRHFRQPRSRWSVVTIAGQMETAFCKLGSQLFRPITPPVLAMPIDISTRSLYSDWHARRPRPPAPAAPASVHGFGRAAPSISKSNSRIETRRRTLQMVSSSSAAPAAARCERNVATKFRMESLATPLAAILPKNWVLHAAARAQSRYILIRTGYCLARPLGGDGELVTILRNIVSGATCDLLGDLLKSAVLGGERDLPFRLDLEKRDPSWADAFEHQVIERKTLVDALETHPGDPCAGHSLCRGSGQHRQKVERPELALDIYARPAPRRWAGSPFLGLNRLATRHRVVVRTVLPRVKEWGRVGSG